MGLEDLERALRFFAATGARQIEIVPAGGDFAPKVGRAAEGLTIKELVFDEAMSGFDITLPGVTLGGM